MALKCKPQRERERLGLELLNPEAMDAAIFVDSSNVAVGDGKREVKIGGAQRKMLSDISNLQNRPRPTNPDAKNKATTITTKEYVDKLEKENVELMKLLVERNKLIELSVVELRKLRVNLQKVQLQNSQLAHANSQMLAELNSVKDRLKALQHELGCKNGLLIAKKLEAGEGGKRITCLNTKKEACSSHDELGESCQADKENKPCNANRRKQAREQSSTQPSVKAVCAKEEVDKKRSCLRRQSAWLISKELEEAEDLFHIDDAEFPVSSMHEDWTDARGQTLLESSTTKEDEGNAIAGSEDLGPPAVKAVGVREETEKKRRSRRQSDSFKTEKSEAIEDSFEIGDAKYHVSSLHDDAVGASGQAFLEVSVKNEGEGNTTTEPDTREVRRSSVGRPLRRAAEKVQSYKEIPLNVKMRRVE